MDQPELPFEAENWPALMVQIRAFDAKARIVQARRSAIIPVEVARDRLRVKARYDCPDTVSSVKLRFLRAAQL
jgi:hypothetical protein